MTDLYQFPFMSFDNPSWIREKLLSVWSHLKKNKSRVNFFPAINVQHIKGTPLWLSLLLLHHFRQTVAIHQTSISHQRSTGGANKVLVYVWCSYTVNSMGHFRLIDVDRRLIDVNQCWSKVLIRRRCQNLRLSLRQEDFFMLISVNQR